MERRSILGIGCIQILPWAFVIAALYLTSRYSYLFFHSLAEIFSIVIACGIFMVAWNSRRFIDNTDLQLRRKDGCRIDVSLNESGVRDEAGKIIHSRSVWRDITVRREMEDEIHKLNKELEERVSERTAELKKEIRRLKGAVDNGLWTMD